MIVGVNVVSNSLCRDFLRRNSIKLRRIFLKHELKWLQRPPIQPCSGDAQAKLIVAGASQYCLLGILTIGWTLKTYLDNLARKLRKSILGYGPENGPRGLHSSHV